MVSSTYHILQVLWNASGLSDFHTLEMQMIRASYFHLKCSSTPTTRNSPLTIFKGKLKCFFMLLSYFPPILFLTLTPMPKCMCTSHRKEFAFSVFIFFLQIRIFGAHLSCLIFFPIKVFSKRSKFPMSEVRYYPLPLLPTSLHGNVNKANLL